jgi:soluble lytic murein transglycosylase-like protein
VASKAKGGGGGVALLFSIAVAFTFPAPHWDYHTLRFWGVSPEPPRDLIEQEVLLAADAHGIDRRLFRALIKVESGGNPKALSPVGAMGLAQIMPFNHTRCGLQSPRDLWDVVHNTRCGARILSEELETYDGDVVKALQAYNGGPRCVGRCQESIQYSKKIIALVNSPYRGS